MKMAYAVLYGQNGTKSFKTKSEAQEFAYQKAKSSGKSVDIDRYNTIGAMRQRTIQTIRPSDVRNKRRSSGSGFKFGGSIASYGSKGFRGLW